MDVKEVVNGDAPKSDSADSDVAIANPATLIRHRPDVIERCDSNECTHKERDPDCCIVQLGSEAVESFIEIDKVRRKTEIDGTSDAEDIDAPAASSFVMESALPDGSWMTLPDHERKLWERLHCKPLRQERSMLESLKLPVSVLNRLVRVHPELLGKSSEAMQIINYATVLMLQAVAHAILRGQRDAHSIRFEDLRQACLNTRELHFLLPVNSAIDSSALLPHMGSPDKGSLARQTVDGLAATHAAIRATDNGETFASIGDAPQEGDDLTDCESAGELTPVKAPSKRKCSNSENKKHAKSRCLDFT